MLTMAHCVMSWVCQVSCLNLVWFRDQPARNFPVFFYLFIFISVCTHGLSLPVDAGVSVLVRLECGPQEPL